MSTVVLLILFNLFMTTAWNWHLRGGMDRPLVVVILISWIIAFADIALPDQPTGSAMRRAGARGS